MLLANQRVSDHVIFYFTVSQTDPNPKTNPTTKIVDRFPAPQKIVLLVCKRTFRLFVRNPCKALDKLTRWSSPISVLVAGRLLGSKLPNTLHAPAELRTWTLRTVVRWGCNQNGMYVSLWTAGGTQSLIKMCKLRPKPLYELNPGALHQSVI
jgi:hypothetical protein